MNVCGQRRVPNIICHPLVMLCFALSVFAFRVALLKLLHETRRQPFIYASRKSNCSPRSVFVFGMSALTERPVG